MSTNPIKTDVQLFFESPGTSPASAGNPAIDPTNSGRPCRRYGILYHLRRNAQCCFETDQTTGEIRAPWPGAMCVMSGIDLLASFHAGTNEMRRCKQLKGIRKSECWRYGVGSRFKRLLTHVAGIPPKDADVIYAFRNTLLHSFGVHDKPRANRFRLIAEASAGPLVQTVGAKLYCINLVELHRTFESVMITNYEHLLTNGQPGSPIQKAFQTMYQDYGWMFVFSTAPTPSGAAIATPAPVVASMLPALTSPVLSGISTGNLMTFSRAASGM